MTAVHFHTTAEVKSAIKKIEHNSDGGNGAPTGIAGSPGYNGVTETPRVTSRSKGDDWVSKRKMGKK